MNLVAFLSGEVPELTEQEALDLVLLRQHYGIGARAAYLEIPEWEIELLLSGIPDREIDADQAPAGDPWTQPPADLDKLNE